MADDKTVVTEKTNSPAGMTSRRQAMGVMGATVSAGVVGAAMPALGATPLHIPTPPPVVVPQGDLVDVLEYEPQARLVAGAAKIAPVAGRL